MKKIGRVLLGLWVVAWSGAIGPGADARTGPEIQNVINSVINKVVVEITGGSAQRREKLGRMAEEILHFTPGERFSPPALLEVVDLLKQTGRFSAIEVPDQNWDAPAIDLRFRLTPVTLVRDIQVNGSFPVFEDDVIDATDYVAGRAYPPESLEKNRAAIAALLVDRGYVDARVDIRTRPTGELSVDVVIDIQKNEPLTIDHIELSGNRAFGETRLKMMMKSYQLPLVFWSTRVIRAEIEKDIKKLVAFYRKKGFADVRIDHILAPGQAPTGRVLRITIHEGPLYRVSFSGHRFFSSFTLKKDLVLATKGNANDFGLAQSMKNIRQRYQSAGFPDCKISYESTPAAEKKGEESGRQLRQIVFSIEENTRYLVKSAEIQGARALDPEVLKTKIFTREKKLLTQGAFVKKEVEADARALEAYYASQGYQGTRVTHQVTWEGNSPKGTRLAHVVFHVTEGRQQMISTLTLEGAPDELAAEIRNQLVTGAGAPFIRSVVQEDRRAVTALLAEKGYIYAEVEAEATPDPSGDTLSLVFRVETKERALAGGVWALGNLRTQDGVILKHNTIQKGDPVSLKAFVDLQQTIRSLNCIERADFRVIGVEERRDRLFFLADVQEKKPYYLETSVGYDTARDGYARLALGDRNFLGMNRELYLDTQVSGTGYDAVLGHKSYDFLSKSIIAEASLFVSQEELKNQTFGSRRYGGEFSLEKKLSGQITAGATVGLEFKEQYALEELPSDDPDIFDMRGIVSLTPFITWNSVDSFVKPTKGVYLNASAGYYRDILEDLDHFIKYRIKAKYFIQPLPRLVLAFQGMGGYVHSFSDSDLPDDQLFFLGGISDVRGYGENELAVDSNGDPVGGRTQISATVEARIDLGANFELPLFIDAGSIRDTDQDLPENFEFTVGTGLRYMTPVGPVGILYGYKLNPGEGQKASGRFHFSVGYTF